MRKKIQASLVLILLVAILGCNKFKLHDQAPDFELPTVLDPKVSIKLSEFNQNKSVLLVFWATWCPTCVSEIPALNVSYDKYHDQDFEILAINSGESRDAIVKFNEQKYSFKFKSVMDATGKVSELYGVRAIPVAVFLAKGGEILYYGFSLPSNLEELIKHG